MRIIGDLHIHSRFSRATSAKLTPSYLDRWARIKGISLLGAGDCTHPQWLKQLREELDDAEPGFFTLKNEMRKNFDAGPAAAEALPNPPGQTAVRFVLTGEISTIYKYGEKTRKVHHLVMLPDFGAAAAFQVRLEQIGNIRSDGRPILGIDSHDLLALLLETDSRSVLIPAHIWTPWFSALGAKSGFDSIEECYRDLASYIPAVETGLSSNPPMNWALQSLDRYTIVSNSDAHSPDKIGREATIFEMEMSFESLGRALKLNHKNDEAVIGTVEFFPQEGKYHYDGHRNCRVCLNPDEAGDRDNICPVCGKAFTPGVISRVLELADRPVDEKAECPQDAGTGNPAHVRNCKPYYSLIPLKEILGELLGTGAASKKVEAAYGSFIEKGGNEFSILMDMPLDEIRKLGTSELPGTKQALSGIRAGSLTNSLAEAVGRMRRGEVFISPGYDGEYGVIRTFAPGEMKQSGAGLFTGNGFADLYEKTRKKDPVNELSSLQTAPKYRGKKKSAKKSEQKNSAFIPDAEQKNIIDSNAGKCLIIAGPGTGKTAVLAEKIAALLRDGTAPASILAVSFTVKAAGELRDRIMRLTGASPAVSTFHSLCASILREQYEHAGLPADFKILGDTEKTGLLEKIVSSHRSAETKPGKKNYAQTRSGVTPAGLGEYIEERKRYLLLPGENTGDLSRVLPPSLSSLLSFIPEKILRPESGAAEPGETDAYPVLETLYSGYRSHLRNNGLVDYEGLIAGAARLLALKKEILRFYREKFRYIFVDEYQDINFAQYVLLRLLVPAESDLPSLWVIGDPNQAIYGFRGSDKAFIDRFLADYPRAQCFRLRRSFRCCQPIINAAGRLTNTELEGVTGANGSVNLFRRRYSTEKSEAEGIARTIASLTGGTSFFAKDSGAASDNETDADPSECAILVRAAALAEPVVKALKDHGMPFEVAGMGAWLEDESVKQIFIYLEEHSSAGQSNMTAAEDEIINAWKTLIENNILPKPRKDEIPEPITRLAELGKISGNVKALLDVLSMHRNREDGTAELPGPVIAHGVRVMTIHSSKGLEFDHVFVPALEEGILPFTLYDKNNDFSEERRLLYVAMTRARRGLWLSCAASRFFKGRILKNPASRFLSELEEFVPLMNDERNYKRDTQMTLF